MLTRGLPATQSGREHGLLNESLCGDGWNLERELWADIWEHSSPHYDPYPHMEA